MSICTYISAGIHDSNENPGNTTSIVHVSGRVNIYVRPFTTKPDLTLLACSKIYGKYLYFPMYWYQGNSSNIDTRHYAMQTGTSCLVN